MSQFAGVESERGKDEEEGIAGRRRFLSRALATTAWAASARLASAQAPAPERRALAATGPAPSPCATPIRTSSSSTSGSPRSRSATRPSSASTPACSGPRGRPGTGVGSTSSGPTSPTTSSCAGLRTTATSASCAIPPATPRQYVRPRRAPDLLRACPPPRRALRVRRQDDRAGRPLRRASRSTRRTTPWSIRTAASVHRPRLRRLARLQGNKGPLEIKEPFIGSTPPRQARQGHRRPLQTQRPLLLPRLQDPLRRRYRRLPLPEAPRNIRAYDVVDSVKLAGAASSRP